MEVKMALIKCNECGKMVSEKANACPHCGNPEINLGSNKKAKNKKISIPEELCFDEKNAYGTFSVGKEGLEIMYSPSGMGKKRPYDIKYNDIQDILLEIAPIPIAVKDLYILVNSEKLHFYVAKSNIERWKELVAYLKEKITGETVETNTKTEETNVSNNQPNNQANKGVRKVGCAPFIIVGIVVGVIVFILYGCVSDFGSYSKYITRIRNTIEEDYTNVTNVVCRDYGSSDTHVSYDCEFKAGGLQVRYEICAICEIKGDKCIIGPMNYQCKDIRK
jgi:hypothetical protein